MTGQHPDFVRWRLGVPVELNTEQVLNRLLSDAYFTDRMLKVNAGDNGIHLTKEERDRAKMERDTIFKVLKAKESLRASSEGEDGHTSAFIKAMSEIEPAYVEHTPRLRSELEGAEKLATALTAVSDAMTEALK